MEEDPLRYDLWIEEALRTVIQRTLKYAVSEGLPGEHHFYITFRTDDDGVVMHGGTLCDAICGFQLRKAYVFHISHLGLRLTLPSTHPSIRGLLLPSRLTISAILARNERRF